jgi:hypothetical protein
MDPAGFEPAAFPLQTERSARLSYGPHLETGHYPMLPTGINFIVGKKSLEQKKLQTQLFLSVRENIAVFSQRH